MKGMSFSEKEIEYLCSNEIWRVATWNERLPHVTPVSYIFSEGKFYFVMDYNTLKYTNLKKNNKISLLVDTNEDNKNKAVVAQGTAKFIHREKNFENLCKLSQ